MTCIFGIYRNNWVCLLEQVPTYLLMPQIWELEHVSMGLQQQCSVCADSYFYRNLHDGAVRLSAESISRMLAALANGLCHWCVQKQPILFTRTTSNVFGVAVDLRTSRCLCTTSSSRCRLFHQFTPALLHDLLMSHVGAFDHGLTAAVQCDCSRHRFQIYLWQ